MSSSPELDPASSLRRAVPRLLESLEAVCRPETLSRGRAYEEEGRVRIAEVGPTVVRGEVTGIDDACYEVSLTFGEGAPVSSCSCPAWGSWDDHCKHVTALAFALGKAAHSERVHGYLSKATVPAIPIERAANAGSSAELDSLRRWLGLPEQSHGFTYDLVLRSCLALGISRSDRPAPASGRWVQVGPYLSGSLLDPADRRVFEAVRELPRDSEGRYLLAPIVAGGVLSALRGRVLASGAARLSFAEHASFLFGELGAAGESRSVSLKLRLGEGQLVPLETARFVSQAPVFALRGAILHPVETAASLEQLERWREEPTHPLRRDAGLALELALGGLRRLGVILDASTEAASAPPNFVLTLDGDAERAQALLAVRYGDVELPLSAVGASSHVTTDGRLLRRDVTAETAAIQVLLDVGLTRAAGAFVAAGDRAVDFWLRGALSLPKDWTYFGPKPKEVVRSRPLTPRMALAQKSTGWFTLEVAFAAEDQSVDLKQLRPFLASGRRYALLSDGSVGELPRELCEQIRSLLDEAGSQPEDGQVDLAPYEAGEIERLLDLVPEARVEPEARRFLAALRDFHGIEEVEVPSGLKAELRAYQRQGLDWLTFLYRAGMSGVLADDMGLGKTVQTLALLLWIKKGEGRMPTLVVTPTSVLPNWKREAERFTPSLKVVVYDGPAREGKRASFAAADVVLTSYALLRRDAEHLRETHFRYVVLDEAQHVKNPASQGAKAARSLRSQRRLALTGTPLENRLADLWSLFHFLLPGFLGSEAQFRTRYARPIEVDGNAAARDRLKRRIRPFILRRLKDEVAKDLPPRTDTVVSVDLSAGQQALYREMLVTARERVESFLDAVGFKKARIGILTELLRLRQVCCDPRLLKLPPGTRLPPSAKLEAFLEMVRDLVGEGHRALVFSQFTEMLGLLKRVAEEEGLSYEYLDGETPNRQEKIDRFNAKDGPPLFFISLKAGGAGLNLTGADYVIHYDPWWNPAAEQQATDRAHRIGQEKPVFSYKLIAKGTVEEKMLRMQEAKKNLAAGLLASDEGLGKVLTEKDIRELFA